MHLENVFIVVFSLVPQSFGGGVLLSVMIPLNGGHVVRNNCVF